MLNTASPRWRSACQCPRAGASSEAAACPRPSSRSGATCSTAAAAARRDPAGAGRLQRHRRDRDPAGQGPRHRDRHGRQRRKMRRPACAGRRPRDQLPRAPDFVAEVARAHGWSGVDVILDMVGRRYNTWRAKSDCLAQDGRLSSSRSRAASGRGQRRDWCCAAAPSRARHCVRVRWRSRRPSPARCASRLAADGRASRPVIHSTFSLPRRGCACPCLDGVQPACRQILLNWTAG